MSTEAPMHRLRKYAGRRLHVALYAHDRALRFSRNWGGRYHRDGRLSPGIGFQLGIGGRVLEVITWSGQEALYPDERIRLVRRSA